MIRSKCVWKILFPLWLVLMMFSPMSVFGEVVINEFMADNETTATDKDGEYEDWIELYNNGTDALSLLGYHITDDNANPEQWTFPDVLIPAGGYLVVFKFSETYCITRGPDLFIESFFKISLR